MNSLRLGKKESGERVKPERKGYRYTVRKVKECLKPLQPRVEFSQRLMEVCSALDMQRIFLETAEKKSRRRRGLVLGGVFSTLPIFGVASYTLLRRHLRRKAAIAH